MNNCIWIKAFDCSIAVVSDCDEGLATMRQFLLPSLPRIEAEIPSPDITLRIVREAHGFRLACNERTGLARDTRQLTIEAIRLLDEEIIKRLLNLTAVHAGAVEIAGRAVLLPGKSFAGKSTLVSELLRAGAAYLSDEYAMIDPDGQVHPYARPLLLRNGGAEQGPVLPDECKAPVAQARLPVGWILALEYGAAASWRIDAISQSEALLILLRNTPHKLIESPRIVPALTRASAGAKCYVGQRGSASEAAQRILQLVSE